MTKKIWEMSALQANELLKKKEISASEVLESSIERIEEVDGELNALPERCFARAILKVLGLYEIGFKSEDESEEFKRK